MAPAHRRNRAAAGLGFDALRAQSDETTEGRFAHVLLERLDHETDPEARATIERALYYGLDAFRLREVAPAWEEIGA